MPGFETRRHQENLLVANEKAKVLLIPSGTLLLWAEMRRGLNVTHRIKQSVTLLWAPYNFSCLQYAKSLARNTFFQNMKHNIAVLIALFKKGQCGS